MFRRLPGIHIACLAAVVMAAPLPVLADKASDHAAIAILLGAAVGKAAAEDQKKEDQRRWGGGKGKAYRVAPGILCYDRVSECYADGIFAPRWTHKVYGY